MKTYVEILKVTKDKKKFIVLTNNGEYKFDEETIINHLVLKGKTFTDDEFEEIIKSEEKNQLFNKTLNFISYQMRSEYEIFSYLKEKDASYEQIDNIIEKLKSFGYINDNELANSLLDSLIRSKKGPKVLANKLQEKKIDEKIIQDTISKYSYDIEFDVASCLVESLKNKKSDYPINKQKQHLYEKLIRDGFSSEIVNTMINNVEFIDNSNETLEKEIEKLEYKYRDLDLKTKKTKMINSLLTKGYDYSNIIKKINE